MSDSGKSGRTPPIKPGRTCDHCRKRKIKCIEDEVDPDRQPCEGCRKLLLDCTYNYVKKKPGRKNSFALAIKAAQEMNNNHHNGGGGGLNGGGPGGSSSGSGSTGPHRTSPLSQTSFHPYATNTPSLQLNAQSHSSVIDPTLRHTLPVLPEYDLPQGSAGPSGSAATATGGVATPSQHLGVSNIASSSSSRPFSSFAFSPAELKNNTDLGWLDMIFDSTGGAALAGTSGLSNASAAGLSGNGGGAGEMLSLPEVGFGMQFASDQAQLLSLESPEHMLATSSNGGGSGALNNLIHPVRREPQLEDVTSWANISHFISLFLQYLYPLLPLVHRPTFAEHLATRRDVRDTDFRALLLSIVAYVISQLPTSRLVNDQFDIESLKRLQRRCHRACKALQRTYYGPTNLTQITTIIFDCFYLLSIGLGHTAGARLGQAIQLAFSMGMHSDAKTNALGLDAIEIQLRRRVFWQLYASDKTRAIPGPPMLITDFQGVCSLPEPTDDEFITSQGMFAQPPSRTSVLAGFVCLSRIFRILSECFFHHRCILSDVRTITTQWTVEAEDRLHQELRDLPNAIQDPMVNGTEAARQVFAMQRANILITAAIAKFALYDLRAALNVDEEQLAHERENIAREIHSLLSNIPVDDLASNGESVRAKVFHIACALCAQAPADSADQGLIRDWCNMFSAISFVQMPPPPPGADVLDSRANSPPGSPAMSRQGPLTGSTQ